MSSRAQQLLALAAALLWGGAACNTSDVLSPDGQIITSAPTGSADGSLHTYVLDVEGASSLVVTPAGHAILFDAGADTTGTKLLAALTAHGVHGLDLVVISHRHANHENGLIALSNAKVVVRSIMVSATPSVDRRMLAVEAAWKRSGARILTPRDTVVAFPDSAQIRLFASPLDSSADTLAVSQDDRGIVMMARFAGRTALLQGDGSYREQEALETVHPGLYSTGVSFLLLADGGSFVANPFSPATVHLSGSCYVAVTPTTYATAASAYTDGDESRDFPTRYHPAHVMVNAEGAASLFAGCATASTDSTGKTTYAATPRTSVLDAFAAAGATTHSIAANGETEFVIRPSGFVLVLHDHEALPPAP